MPLGRPNAQDDELAAGTDDEYYGEDEGEEEVNDMEESEDEDYNLTHFGISQALPVPDGPPDFSSGPPQTAEEYLQWVRHEAQRCPRVTRKEIDPAKLAAAEAASNSRAAAASASTPSTTGRRGAAAAAGGPGKGAGSGNRGAGQGPKTLGVKRAGEGIERAGIADQDHEEGQEGTGEEAGEEVAVGGGGSLAAVRASATARAYSLLAAAPGACGCSEWARPNPKWLRVFVQDFAQLRQALVGMQQAHAAELQRTRLPPPENGAAWDRLCFEQWQSLEQQQQGAGPGQQGGEAGSPPGVPPPPPPGDPPPGSGTAGEGAAGGGETDRICGPVLRTVLAMDQVCVAALIQRHVDQLPSQPCLSYLRSQWLFALAAALERPVPPDVSAALRSLVRQCTAWRAALAGPGDPSLPRLNILLAVAGGYFGQDEELCGAVAAMGLGDLA